MAEDDSLSPASFEDEVDALMQRPHPVGPDDDIDAMLHFAQMQRRFGLAADEPVGWGRWDLEERLGRGGMGIVYLARDRNLGRRVALKLLPQHDDAEGTRARMIAEARALAQVDHPNVRQIYGVHVDGPRPVIELEYVEGLTLGHWILQRSPTWREIVVVHIDAAEGLAALHGAGLVHRDVKPDNLLIDERGRVKVSDLGLATRPSEHGERRDEAVGTHGYMSPETIALGISTPASDQFSFGVTLFEALYGVKPFSGETPGELADAMRKGSLAIPGGGPGRPGWLLATLRRALAFEPHSRYESMDELARSLRRGLGRRRLALSLTTLVALGSGLLALGWWVKPEATDACERPREGIDGVWTPAIRDEVRLLVGRQATPQALASSEVFEAAMDRRVESWLDSSEAECRDRLRDTTGARRTDLLDARRACLDYTRSGLDALVEGLGEADPGLPARLVSAATEVERLPECLDDRSLIPWSSGTSTDELGELTDELSTSVALEGSGRLAESEARLRGLLERSRDRQPLIHAEALFRLGHVLGAAERATEAFEVLDDARNAALAIQHLPLMCRAAAHQAKLAANVALDSVASARELGLARACAAGTDAHSPLLLADILEAEGLLASTAGRVQDAVGLHEQSLELRRRHLGPVHDEVSKSLHNLANAQLGAGQYDAARGNMLAALEIRERLLGPEHPETANILHDLGRACQAEGSLDEARRYLERAASIYESRGGSDSPALASTHLLLAAVALDAGANDKAAQHLSLAARLHERARDLPADHPQRAARFQLDARLAVAKGDLPAALEALRRSTEILRRRAPVGPDTLDSVLREIAILFALGEHREVVRRHDGEGDPLRTLRAALPPSDRGMHAWYLGESLRAVGDLTRAKVELESARTAYSEIHDDQSVAELSQLIDTITQDDP